MSRLVMIIVSLLNKTISNMIKAIIEKYFFPSFYSVWANRNMQKADFSCKQISRQKRD
jgi:hypothetical protein